MKRSVLLVAFLAALAFPAHARQQDGPRVRTVLFFSPTCPHCHEVITNGLPPIVERFGESLTILVINVQTLEGQRLFQAAGRQYGIPAAELGVPLLAVAEHALVGSYEIPSRLPDIVEEGLAAGGIDWPPIEGLREALAASGMEVGEQPPAPEVAVTDLAGAESSATRLSPWQNFAQDPGGNTIAVIVLAGMLLSVVIVLSIVLRRGSLPSWPGTLVTGLILVGLVVAAYLSWVELTYAEAVCGPVGDCNAVQESPYARLFGVLPVGVLGLYAYAALGLGWLLVDRASPRWNRGLAGLLWLLALLGTLFSMYLTVLEPFVIGATCMWCVTSAVVMTLLLWAATPVALEAWSTD